MQVVMLLRNWKEQSSLSGSLLCVVLTALTDNLLTIHTENLLTIPTEKRTEVWKSQTPFLTESLLT